ncbi:Calcium/calmodulin-dependent 3',5'-cyclic nucleotide phosphodiesterase 1C [Tetrabaena socialis]|uniref:Calcium/calmodulin-dependent 3',5'-cyclic nucleotide phosphodiesterase 1C n=1 Tax=Tetrabaena socialis TaxID=47790 RepID=A0A2J8AIU7_9CHLO|nr:Calcium/calmodulin-dependent 3',5'-cyclic nucleotide phosphodiesterase 1C [Tetrabaena socialis]|eukprot:PNH12446.1 Calcium/calmodulin-dependent 3',5'-cyclic nucleotide phosphodiesterase 1C [Tetrabaena socialis]
MQATSLVTDAALSLRQQLSIAAGPVYTLSALVHYNPNFDAVSAVFRSSFAYELSRQASGMRGLLLSPYGVIRLAYPLEGNSGALGFDIFASALDGESAVQTVKEGKLTLVGPLPFQQGGSGVRVVLPIFVNASSANTSFGGPDSQNPRCGAACYNQATGSKFWGFASVIIDLDALSNGTDSRLRSLEDRGFAYELTAPLGANRLANLTVLARSLGRRPSDDAVSAIIELPNNQWILRLSPSTGSWQPSWYAPVLAGLVVLAVVVCGLQFVVLVSRRQHQMLLEALLPRELIEDLVSRDTASIGPRVMQTDTPADTLLKMMGCLLEGGTPDLRDVLFLRTTVLRNLDIYQPLDLRGHIKGANLDADVTRALMRQLGGGAGSDETDLLYDDLPNDAAALATHLYDSDGGGEGEAGAAAVLPPHECGTLQGALALILTTNPAGWYDPGGYDATDAMSDAALPAARAESLSTTPQHRPTSALAPAQLLREAQASPGGSTCEGGGGRPGSTSPMPSGAGRGGGPNSGTFQLPTPPCRQASTTRNGEGGGAAYGSAAVFSAPADPETSAGPPATAAASTGTSSVRVLLTPSATGALLHPKKRSLVVSPSAGSQLVPYGATAPPPSISGTRSANLSGILPAFDEALLLGRAGGGGGGAGGGGLLQTRMARRQAGLPPPPAILEEVERLLGSADCWQFDMWRLREATQGHPLSALGFYLMQRQGLIARFRLDPVKLARLLRHIEAGYPDNPYHNATHAADVLQTLHVIIHGGQLHVHYLDPLGLLAAYFAAVGFYDFVVNPLVYALSGAFPGTSPLMRSFSSNYNHWVSTASDDGR